MDFTLSVIKGIVGKKKKGIVRFLNRMVKLSYIKIDDLGCYVQSKINNKETIE